MNRFVDLSAFRLDVDCFTLGLVQGQHFRDRIVEFHKVFKDFSSRRARAQFGFIGSLLSSFSLSYLFRQGEKFEPFINEDFRREMQGIAEGSGQDYRFIRLLNVLDDMINLSLCSAVGVCDPQTQSYVYGSNLDYQLFLETMRDNVFVVKKRNFVTVGFPGYIGVLRGVNRWGLFLASLTSKTKKQSNYFGMPNGLLYNMVMNCADAIDTAARVIKIAARGASNNVLLGTRDDAVVVEFNKDYFLEIRPEKNSFGCSRVGVTNHFRSPELAQYQEMSNPPFAVEVSDEHLTKTFSEQRLAAIESLSAADLKTALTSRYPSCNEGTIFTTLVNFAKKELNVIIPHRREELTVPLEW